MNQPPRLAEPRPHATIRPSPIVSTGGPNERLAARISEPRLRNAVRVSPFISFGDPRERLAAHLMSRGSTFERSLPMAPPLPARRVVVPIADETWFALAGPVLDAGRVWQGTRVGLACISLFGDTIWTQPKGASTDAVALSGDLVLSGARDGQVRAWDRANFAPLWEYQAGDWVSGLAPLPIGGVVVSTRAGEVLRLDNSGTLQWRALLPSRVFAAACVGPDAVYVGARDGRFYSIGLVNGDVQRVCETGSDVHGAAHLVDDTVYFGSDDKRLYALDAHTFAVRWMFRTGEAVWSRPVVASGLLCFASTDGYAYGVDPTSGRPIWESGCGSPVRLGLATDGEDIYVATEGGALITFSGATGEARTVNKVDGAVWAAPAASDGTIFVASRGSGLWTLDGRRRN